MNVLGWVLILAALCCTAIGFGFIYSFSPILFNAGLCFAGANLLILFAKWAFEY